MQLEEIGKNAKEAERFLRVIDTNKKNEVLLAAAEQLKADSAQIIAQNAIDLENARKKGMPEAIQDRLLLNRERIAQMAEGLCEVAALEDPIGEVLSMKKRPNGLRIGKKRVPIGVIGIIYESRPNVTSDAFGLCFKTGNVVILRGGSDALLSNEAIVASIQKALEACSVPRFAIQLLCDTSHETAEKFMRMNEYMNLLIPRGGAGLIKTVVKNATVPVIETGTGNCHIFVDETADFVMAADIIFNAKTQRVGVCNACESILVHEKIVAQFMPLLARKLKEKEVEIRGDEEVQKAVAQQDNTDMKVTPATEEDWGTEYLDYILSAKTVSGVDEAIAHINRYNTGHSEAIITDNYTNAEKFLNEVDAAAVYVNASTRFTDGFEFGFGAEIGISTQKLHARGPMGLEALTSTKYIIYGNGQIRK